MKNYRQPKDDLEGFPGSLIVKMLDYQEKQGNPRNQEIFEKSRTSPKSSGGFNWDLTEEGYDYWENILVKGNIPDNYRDRDYRDNSIITFTNEEKYLVYNGIAIKLDPGTIRAAEWIDQCGLKIKSIEKILPPEKT